MKGLSGLLVLLLTSSVLLIMEDGGHLERLLPTPRRDCHPPQRPPPMAAWSRGHVLLGHNGDKWGRWEPLERKGDDTHGHVGKPQFRSQSSRWREAPRFPSCVHASPPVHRVHVPSRKRSALACA